jgi:ComF family protein
MSLQFSSLCQSVLHFLYPRLCGHCSRLLLPEEEVLCLGCCISLPQTRYHHISDNETALRFAGRFPFVQATSYAYFVKDGMLQHLLHQLKYEGRKANGIFLGRQLGSSLLESGWFSDISCIVPVPLHPRKKQQRGFNQADLIAEGIREISGRSVEKNVLERVRNTDSQTRKSREERLDNMSAAFKISQGERIRGKHILLLDDVLTTGATLEACSRSILSIPGTRVSLATVGIAVS